jgi:hypothetical protein
MSEPVRVNFEFKLEMPRLEFLARFGAYRGIKFVAEARLLGGFSDSPKSSYWALTDIIPCLAVPDWSDDGEGYGLVLCRSSSDFFIRKVEHPVEIRSCEITIPQGGAKISGNVRTVATVTTPGWIQNSGDRIRLPSTPYPYGQPLSVDKFDPLLALAALEEAEKAFA